MLRAHLTLALRSLWRNRLYTTINVGGLAVGLACVTLIYWQLQQIHAYDRFHQDVDRLYLVHEKTPTEAGLNANTVVPALPALLQTYPALEAGTRVLTIEDHWLRFGKRESANAESVMHVDTGFFNVFTFPLRLGDARTALQTPNGLVLSDKVATALFGSENPLGKVVQFDNDRSYVVRGVLAPYPPNSSIQPRVMLPMSDLAQTNPAATESWYTSSCRTYVKLRPGASVSALTAQWRGFVQAHYHPDARTRQLVLLPFVDVFAIGKGALLPIIQVGLALIAGFILLIVLINFLNLTSALSLARLGEVAVRTTLGSGRWAVVRQFMVETGLVAVVGAILGVLLLQLVLPGYINHFKINEMFSPALPLSTVWLLLGAVLLLGGVAGFAPAWHLTALPVVRSLQGNVGHTKTPFRNALVVVQFMLATILIGCTGVMLVQNQFVRSQQLGFVPDNVVVFTISRTYRDPAAAEGQFRQVMQTLRNNPDVLTISTSPTVPGQNWGESTNDFRLASANTAPWTRVYLNTIDDAFLATMQIQLREGRNLSAQFAGDTLGQNVLINEAARRALGLTSAVGQVITAKGIAGSRGTIVGVIGDFNSRGMHHTVQPAIYYGSGPARLAGNNCLSLQVRPGSAPAVVALTETMLRQIPARQPVRYAHLSDNVNQNYWVMDSSREFLTCLALITIGLASLGIFGLSIFTARQRTRELGIRKVLGASAEGLVWLLAKRLLTLVTVAVAAVLAGPLTFLMMSAWLKAFTVRVSFPFWILAGAGLLSVIIALSTVSFQSLRAALSNPVNALRSE